MAVRWRWWRAGGGGGELAAVVESWQWWMVGDTFSTRFCLAGCGFHRFIFFHFPAKKSVQREVQVGSDPRAGYFFNEAKFRAPPRGLLAQELERGGV